MDERKVRKWRAMKAIESTRKVGGRFALADYFAPILLVDDGYDCFKYTVSRINNPRDVKAIWVFLLRRWI